MVDTKTSCGGNGPVFAVHSFKNLRCAIKNLMVQLTLMWKSHSLCLHKLGWPQNFFFCVSCCEYTNIFPFSFIDRKSVV